MGNTDYIGRTYLAQYMLPKNFVRKFLKYTSICVYIRWYYLQVRDFAQILGHVFGSENMKEATVVDPNSLKKSSYEYFEFYFYKMVKNRLLQTTIKKSKKSYIQLQNRT